VDLIIKRGEPGKKLEKSFPWSREGKIPGQRVISLPGEGSGWTKLRSGCRKDRMWGRKVREKGIGGNYSGDRSEKEEVQ